jgi:hypothetical protein
MEIADGGFSEPSTSGESGRFKADRSSLPGDFGESFGPNKVEKMSPENRAKAEQLRQEHIESLDLLGKTERFGRALFGFNAGPFDLQEWGFPAGKAVDFGAKALALGGGFLPVPGAGLVLGQLVKALGEIATGSHKDWGGGFRPGNLEGPGGLEPTILAGGPLAPPLTLQPGTPAAPALPATERAIQTVTPEILEFPEFPATSHAMRTDPQARRSAAVDQNRIGALATMLFGDLARRA